MPFESSEDARAAVLTSWAGTTADDRTTRTAAGRQAANLRFELEADPHGVLDPAERARRAAALRRAHMSALGKKGAATHAARRARRRARTDNASPADEAA